MQGDAWNVKAYRDSSSPFMGDYSGMTSVKQRLVFDPEVPASEPFWEDNSSFDIRNPDKEPLFWMSFVSSRNVSGDIFTARMPDQVPFARTPYSSTAAIVAPDNATATNPDAGSENPMAALSVEDFNPGAGFCTPVENPGTAIAFDALNNRTKQDERLVPESDKDSEHTAFVCLRRGERRRRRDDLPICHRQSACRVPGHSPCLLGPAANLPGRPRFQYDTAERSRVYPRTTAFE
jgi:hypothetical protein